MRIALNASVNLLLGSALVGLVTACSSTADSDAGGAGPGALGDYSTADMESMLAGAESVGLSATSLAFENGRILAETDMLLDPQTLLELGHEHAALGSTASPLNGPGLTPEGYFSPSLAAKPPLGRFTATPPRANSIRLKFDADVSSAWKKAIRDAAGQWDSNECIAISENRGSDNLRIAIDATLPANVASVAYLPQKRNGVVVPGPQISVNPTATNASWLLYSALHDIGHVLGYMHPASGVLIPGTSADTQAGDTSSYSTVMSLGGPIISALSADDKTSRDLIFKKIPKQVTQNGRPVIVLECPNGTDGVVL